VPQSARFSIDAKTEVMTITSINSAPLSDWGEISGFVVTPQAGDCLAARLVLNEPPPAGTVAVATAEPEGLQIAFKSPNGESLGLLTCGQQAPRPAPDYFVAVWPPEARTTLRISGDIILGAEISRSAQTAKVLREGTISLFASSWPFRTGSVTSDLTLRLGDEVRFLDGDVNAAPGFGLLRLDDDLIHVVAHVRAHEAQVVRPGQEQGQALVVAPTFLQRVYAQAEWAIILLTATLALNFLGTLMSVAATKPDAHS